MMTEDYAAALAYANEVRAEAGLEPLDALPEGKLLQGGDECPLGRACPGWFFHGCGVRSWDGPGDPHGPKEVKLSPLVERFIARFDAKQYPELIV